MAGKLTRERIISEATAVIDAEGLDKLSMRAVASRLGVEAMSLYRHVANKGEMLDAVYDGLIDSLETPAAERWQDAVTQLATAFRTLMFAHPRCAPLLATRAATTPRSMRLVEDGVSLLTDEGFSEDDAIVAFQTVFTFCVGHVVFHTAGGQDLHDDDWARYEFAEGVGAILAGLEARTDRRRRERSSTNTSR